MKFWKELKSCVPITLQRTLRTAQWTRNEGSRENEKKSDNVSEKVVRDRATGGINWDSAAAEGTFGHTKQTCAISHPEL